MPTYYFITNAVSSGVLDTHDRLPEAKVMIWERRGMENDHQLWKFKDGFLFNRATDYVLEAPTIDGKIKPGTELIQVGRRHTHNLNQKWKYEEYRLVSELDDGLCIWGKNDNVYPGVYAIADTVQQREPTQRWLFLEP